MLRKESTIGFMWVYGDEQHPHVPSQKMVHRIHAMIWNVVGIEIRIHIKGFDNNGCRFHIALLLEKVGDRQRMIVM